ncbi:unnamed protein product [Cuscuta epithymum]|uniref:No apical meristem-associated C-terminal domain-containing protein n=1 Tax=Cuscuta epithymum TaxID=186058 RepID=A0AAV0FMC9_9ASTE|nr:unnamed protein product [Cuscuta epithymum]
MDPEPNPFPSPQHPTSVNMASQISEESSTKKPKRVKSDGIVRPEGRKSCKEKKRKLNAEIGVVEVINKVQCILEKQIEFNVAALQLRRENQQKEYAFREQVMKRKIELKEKKLELKMKELEMKERAHHRAHQEFIMHLDLSKLPPTVRATYEVIQAKILKEWEIGYFSGI